MRVSCCIVSDLARVRPRFTEPRPSARTMSLYFKQVCNISSHGCTAMQSCRLLGLLFQSTRTMTSSWRADPAGRCYQPRTVSTHIQQHCNQRKFGVYRNSQQYLSAGRPPPNSRVELNGIARAGELAEPFPQTARTCSSTSGATGTSKKWYQIFTSEPLMVHTSRLVRPAAVHGPRIGHSSDKLEAPPFLAGIWQVRRLIRSSALAQRTLWQICDSQPFIIRLLQELQADLEFQRFNVLHDPPTLRESCRCEQRRT